MTRRSLSASSSSASSTAARPRWTTPDSAQVEIDMTMTAPGCGMGEVLQTDAARAVAAVPGVDRVEVNLVWEPRWSMQHMSDAARLQLGLL